ncbi:MFS transporter, partial [Caballeronia sp. M23-90]
TGAIVLAAGLLITLTGVHTGNAGIFFVGTIIAGMGFGAAFQGSLRLLLTGAIVLAAGLLITLTGVHTGNAGIFFVGTIIAGMGFGAAFQG